MGVCAFLVEDINSLSSKQFEQLQEYHYADWNVTAPEEGEGGAQS
jgi:hypothetical protein